MATEVTATEILRLRLATQRIDPTPQSSVAQTVRHLLAVQAQDFAQALWAVGVRTPGSTRAQVRTALERGEVVRTLPMRGTLHFVPAEDLGWMLALTSARSLQGAATRFANLGLDRATLDRAATVTEAALRGGNALTRDEFTKMLEANGIAPDGQRGYHIIFFLTQLQLVCWGPPRGTQQALVLVEEWITNPRELDREESLREFALRYFTSHGPATERDFAWWTKLTLADARAGIAAAFSELTELRNDETSFWVATSELDAAATSRIGSRVHALPGFDEYLLGYADRSLALPAAHAQRIVPGSNGIFLPTIVSKGRIIGTWRRTPKSKSAAIEAEHFEEATPAQHRSFDRAAAAYAKFVDA
jgi:Winged helix DNA-binding domain